jgi:uncharacterized paraquat-inducible protein A
MACVRCGLPLAQYTVLCTRCGANQYQFRVTARGLFWAAVVGGVLILALALLAPLDGPNSESLPPAPAVHPPVGHP